MVLARVNEGDALGVSLAQYRDRHEPSLTCKTSCANMHLCRVSLPGRVEAGKRGRAGCKKARGWALRSLCFARVLLLMLRVLLFGVSRRPDWTRCNKMRARSRAGQGRRCISSSVSVFQLWLTHFVLASIRLNGSRTLRMQKSIATGNMSH